MNINAETILSKVTSHAIIAHVCNNTQVMDTEFFESLAKKYKVVLEKFLFLNSRPGEIQAIPVTNNLIVVNLIAKQGIKTDINRIPLSKPHLKICLEGLRELGITMSKPVHVVLDDNKLIRLAEEVSSKFNIWVLP